ncbi:MAG: hypothetical protein K0U34_01080 [Alphaproteobacteria bacterium]|nr:hypothetical protein [Alphaproteobacteria bacterium]
MSQLNHTASPPRTGGRTYSIATLVTDPLQYDAMKQSFAEFGFAESEFLCIDNTGQDQICAYRGLNQLLNQATGDVVILCHQDVRLFDDGRETLEACLDNLEQHHPTWAVAGNAGGVAPGQLALRITDPHGADQTVGALPEEVRAVDENFIVVRRDARIGFSQDLSGFHFYGADICMMAAMAGYTAHVINFHLAHLSAGKKDTSFDAMEAEFCKKWNRALNARWIQTTCSLVYLSGAPLKRMAGELIQRPLAKLSKHGPQAAGWK